MNNVEEYRDLCINCNYALLCTKRKNLVRPVWFCEEFDDFVPPKKEENNIPKKAKMNSTLQREKEDSKKYKGICSNCEIRDTCQYPRYENGIWHCEEYK